MSRPTKLGKLYASQNGAIWKCIQDGSSGLTNVRLLKQADPLLHNQVRYEIGYLGRLTEVFDDGERYYGNSYTLVREILP